MTLLLPLEELGSHDLAYAAGLPVVGIILISVLLLAAVLGLWLGKQGKITLPRGPALLVGGIRPADALTMATLS